VEFERVLITGGLGFIGSAAAEHFLSGGARVVIVDNLATNVSDPGGFGERFASVEIIESDVEGYLARAGALGASCDLVIHTASVVGPASLLDLEGRIGPLIVSATAAVLEACLASDVPLVFLSSAEVYGRSGRLGEGSDIRIPPYYNARLEYALAKLTSEAMVLNSRARGLPGVVIRPFNVAGQLQSRAGGFVMPSFVQQALGNRPLTVFGSGAQKRAFLGVSDLVRFLRDSVPRALDGDACVYNVGNPGNETTILDLAYRVRRLLGSRSEIVHVDPKEIYGPRYEEAESFEKLPDIKNAQAIGWEPAQSLDEIILEVAEYYRAAPDTRGTDARGERPVVAYRRAS
jgi:nucleoside-diphosphate-sugar epimerase